MFYKLHRASKFIAVCVIVLASTALAADPKPALNLLALGDWGMPTQDRITVADAMADYAAKSDQPVDACLLLGDNFYVKLKNVNDPLIQTMFEETYDQHRLNIPFYAVLGNHDYEGDKKEIELQYPKLHPESRWKMPSPWYRLDLPEKSPIVTILMLDSNQQAMPSEDWHIELGWLEAQLSGKRAAWTICCAHHDMFSNGAHSDNGVLQRDWGTLFTKYKVDFYLCGHDHTLQHLEMPGWTTSFVISGGGSGKLKPMLRDKRGPFSQSIFGFGDFRFDPDSVTVSLVDGHGNMLHQFTRDTKGNVKTIMTTPNDPATDKPLKVIQGIDESPTTKSAN